MIKRFFLGYMIFVQCGNMAASLQPSRNLFAAGTSFFVDDFRDTSDSRAELGVLTRQSSSFLPSSVSDGVSRPSGTTSESIQAGLQESVSASPSPLVGRPSFFTFERRDSLSSSDQSSEGNSRANSPLIDIGDQCNRRAISREFAALSNRVFALCCAAEYNVVTAAILSAEIQQFKNRHGHQQLCSDDADHDTVRSCDNLISRIADLDRMGSPRVVNS